jgi:AraC-like DNA-binding protein
MAGIIRNGTGVSFSSMRILGSFAVVYLLGGSGRFADARGINQKVQAGDLLIVFPEIAHAYGPGRGEHWDEIYLVFDGPAFDLWRTQGLLDPTRPVMRLEPIEYWHQRIESIARTSREQTPLATIVQLLQLLADIREHQLSRGINDADRNWLTRAKMLLAQDIPLEDFDLESIAQELGMSYVAFRKKFARLGGTSPAKFHMKSVIDRACDVMRRQHMTNRQVAQQLGFCDEFHFSRRFKQIVGVSPREFRQQIPRGK